MTDKQRRWLKRSGIGAGALVALLVLLIVATKFWIAPAVIRGRLEASLDDVWRGEVDVGDVTFRFFGPLELSHLRMRDEDGRDWISLETLELHLSDWPSTHPKLSIARAGKLDVRAHVIDGKVVWPFEPPEPKEEPADWRSYLDLQEVKVERITLGAIDEEGHGVVWADYELTVTPTSPTYKLTLARPDAGEDAELRLDGEMSLDGAIDVKLDLDRELTEEDVAAVLAAIGKSVPVRGALRAEVDVRISGNLARPAGIRATGPVMLSGGGLDIKSMPSMRDYVVDARLDGRRASVTTARVRTCDGEVYGRGDIAWLGGGKLGLTRFRGSITGVEGSPGLSLPQFGRAIGRRIESGHVKAEWHGVSGTIHLTDRKRPVTGMAGQGHVVVRDLPAGPLQKVLAVIIPKVGLEMGKAEKKNFHASFALDGEKISFEDRKDEARLIGPLNAIVVSDGTADLYSKEIELAVQPIQQQFLDQVIPDSPELMLPITLAEQLTTFLVTGRWDDAASIRVAPAGKVIEGTTEGILEGILEIDRIFTLPGGGSE